MRCFYPVIKYVLSIFLLMSFCFVQAQVGIGTTNPNSNALLDIDATATAGGLLLPRVALINTNNVSPLTAHVAGMTIYNTASTGDVTPGYYYNDGTRWVRIAASGTEKWDISGNTGTNAGSNFIGTTDNVALRIRTNNSNRFEYTTNGRLRSFDNGSQGAPTFSWRDDIGLGMYRVSDDNLGFSTNGSQRLSLSNNNTVFNEGGNNIDFRVETDNQQNMLFVDGGGNAIGMGTDSPSGVLELNSANSGFVLPRVALQGTNVQAPIVNPSGGALEAGTTVYNTATAGTIPNNVAPGLYYWNGTRWVAYAGSPGGLDWTLTGNSGTSIGTNFIGTTDAMPLDFRVNSLSEAWIGTNGFMVINSDDYFGGYTFFNNTHLQSMAINAETAIGGYGNTSTQAIYGQNIGGGTVGTFLNTAGDSMRALTSLSTGTGVQGSGGTFTSYSMIGESSGGVFAGTNGTVGISTSITGTGVSGLGQGRLNIVVNTDGSGVAASGNSLGLYAYAGFGDTDSANYGNAAAEFTLDTDDDVTTTTGSDATRARAKLAGFDNVTPNGSLNNRESYYGGYFSGGNEDINTPSYAYVGMRYRTNGNGSGTIGGSGQDYKIIGTGSVSTLIDGPDGNPRVMFAPEAPEILFQDFGIGQLVNGVARINIDPILKESIYVDAQNPLKVYVTLEGDCNGVYVTEKSGNGFTVKELQGGTSNAAFSWQIVASRADRVAANGTMVSKHVGIRLPEGPAPLAEKKYISKKIESEEETIKDQKDVRTFTPRTTTQANTITNPGVDSNTNQKRN